ncbi:MAG: sulfite exporter TauE/SafE family protein [Desulfuromonadales bacterium]|uniref:sulfite exporter TauE/SafE family protein n=1 Tax=Desulfuromonas sp. KJ2020 TaxID=2919173 RepID=UPI000325BE9F|nr:sulfite exporter TauE/SafE family protein [Desulfuromonas sp. KJ2020]MCP3176126.1 sulfite exporter TauE/SafE family protein [Desulfuromonas sp. KJ2020]
MTFWLLYLATGAFTGVFAGLLGVGGGLIVVPLLTFVFTSQQMPEAYILHLALGTSLASIILTSISSFRAHHARGAVHWGVVRGISLGILTGTFFGSWVAAQLSGRFLSAFFVVFLYTVSLRMFFNVRPKASMTLPKPAGLFAVGNVIGGVSSLVGIGGGSLSVPFLVRCNLPVHTAVGTSAAIGFPIAVAGTAGYVLNGLAVAELPAGSLGFVYLPALAGICLASVLTAPLGVRLAHSLPVARLKRIFALFLMVMGTRLLFSFF